MAEIGDVFAEWEKLNTPGKIAIGGAAVAVAIIALAVGHRQAMSTGTPSHTSANQMGGFPLGPAPTDPNSISSGIVNGLTQAFGQGVGTPVATVTATPTPVATVTTTASPTTPTYTAPATWTKPISTYTVQSGDWLSKITASHPSWGINWQQLYGANVGTIGGNPNLIRPGQVLTIPGV